MSVCEGRTCSYCNGTGNLSRKSPCSHCLGNGYFQITKLEKTISNNLIESTSRFDFVMGLIAIIECNGSRAIANEARRLVYSEDRFNMD